MCTTLIHLLSLAVVVGLCTRVPIRENCSCICEPDARPLALKNVVIFHGDYHLTFGQSAHLSSLHSPTRQPCTVTQGGHPHDFKGWPSIMTPQGGPLSCPCSLHIFTCSHKVVPLCPQLTHEVALPSSAALLLHHHTREPTCISTFPPFPQLTHLCLHSLMRLLYTSCFCVCSIYSCMFVTIYSMVGYSPYKRKCLTLTNLNKSMKAANITYNIDFSLYNNSFRAHRPRF